MRAAHCSAGLRKLRSGHQTTHGFHLICAALPRSLHRLPLGVICVPSRPVCFVQRRLPVLPRQMSANARLRWIKMPLGRNCSALDNWCKPLIKLRKPQAQRVRRQRKINAQQPLNAAQTCARALPECRGQCLTQPRAAACKPPCAVPKPAAKPAHPPKAARPKRHSVAQSPRTR